MCFNLYMYTATVLDHFNSPRNTGELENADVTVEHSNPACGDRLRMQLKFTDGRISAMRYKVKGCTPSYACASVLSEMVIGKSPEDAMLFTPEMVVEALGGLMPGSVHASHLAAETLHEAIMEYTKK